MNLMLESERLLLRPLAEGDLDVCFEIFTDPAVMQFVGETYTRDRVVEELPTAMRRGGRGCIGVWCVIDRATAEKLGTALLLPLPIEEKDTNWDLVGGDDLPEGEIEIGYILKASAWGKGYATEACRRLLQFAFEDSPLEEVVAVTHPDNAVSQRVLRKSGLIAEGPRRAYASDCPGFRITRGQWVARDRGVAAGGGGGRYPPPVSAGPKVSGRTSPARGEGIGLCVESVWAAALTGWWISGLRSGISVLADTLGPRETIAHGMTRWVVGGIHPSTGSG